MNIALPAHKHIVLVSLINRRYSCRYYIPGSKKFVNHRVADDQMVKKTSVNACSRTCFKGLFNIQNEKKYPQKRDGKQCYHDDRQ